MTVIMTIMTVVMMLITKDGIATLENTLDSKVQMETGRSEQQGTASGSEQRSDIDMTVKPTAVGPNGRAPLGIQLRPLAGSDCGSSPTGDSDVCAL